MEKKYYEMKYEEMEAYMRECEQYLEESGEEEYLAGKNYKKQKDVYLEKKEEDLDDYYDYYDLEIPDHEDILDISVGDVFSFNELEKFGSIEKLDIKDGELSLEVYCNLENEKIILFGKFSEETIKLEAIDNFEVEFDALNEEEKEELFSKINTEIEITKVYYFWKNKGDKVDISFPNKIIVFTNNVCENS